MSALPRLAVFDVDGTIVHHGNVPESVVEGMRHLRRKGCITTVSTGRGFVRLREALGDNFDNIISPEALIIVEHGTKIVDRSGNLKFGEFFSDREIDHIVDFTRANIELFKLVWFNPVDVKDDKVQVWCVDEKDVQFETEKRSHYANVFTSSIGELEDILLTQRLTNVTLKLKDYVKVENLKLAFTRTDTNVIFQDGNMEFVKNNTNKGLAIEWMARRLRVHSNDLLVAGNAINDVEMLDIDSKITVLVGPKEVRGTIRSYLSKVDELIEVDSPAELGEHLLTL